MLRNREEVPNHHVKAPFKHSVRTPSSRQVCPRSRFPKGISCLVCLRLSKSGSETNMFQAASKQAGCVLGFFAKSLVSKLICLTSLSSCVKTKQNRPSFHKQIEKDQLRGDTITCKRVSRLRVSTESRISEFGVEARHAMGVAATDEHHVQQRAADARRRTQQRAGQTAEGQVSRIRRALTAPRLGKYSCSRCRS